MRSVLLIGLGRFGSHIAEKLCEMHCQVLAVDNSEERVSAVLPMVTAAQIGDSTSRAFLSGLGVPSFDVCIVAIGDNFQNSLETAAILKDLGAKKVIARAASEMQEKFLLRNGADEVVYPEKQLAAWTAVRCSSRSILDYIELDGDCSLFELAVPPAWSGKTVVALDIRKKYGLNILGIREGGRLNTEVGPDTVLGTDESMLVLGKPRAVQRCFRI